MSDPPPAATPATDDAAHARRGGEASTRRSSDRGLAVAAPRDAHPTSARDAHASLAQQAEAHVGVTINGWRLAKLLGVGPVSAAYEATRGARDGGGAVRGTLRLMIGPAARDERSRAHFTRAAYAANRFPHPRVLGVVADGADESGAPFVVRAWSDGEPIGDVVKRDGTIPERRVLKIAEQVLDALEIAHAHGVVHGAIGPTNVLLTQRGSIRLCDFASPPGLGPRPDDEADVLAPRRASPWSPPERCSSAPAPASEATDVYGLAATMYFAATGVPPRGEARTIDELARTPARPAREVAPQLSEPFAAVIDHALQADPTKRYDSAYAMLGDVRRALAGRKPKLGEAVRPNPSGSYSGLAPALTSQRRLSNPPSRVDGRTSSMLPVSTLRTDMRARARAADWKGNVALILAIALLVGVATYVMVRERVQDERRHGRHGAAAVAAPDTTPDPGDESESTGEDEERR